MPGPPSSGTISLKTETTRFWGKTRGGASCAALVDAPAASPRTWSIAVLPGDGIGLEVIAEARKVLDAVAGDSSGLRFEYAEHSVGAAEYLRSGKP